ncbi:hypothetical protein EZV62_028169 [Acer yangbiense]|uniref:Pentacotripeptide-repeat region of PRORP domain-containing protein n=1 Tax=Acer yangbiense TaxID=1000413 RepID=A0A5C7GNZ3_9ROSI|nr:hypothetical protein EZV62_028169 [Acer yangbiense]
MMKGYVYHGNADEAVILFHMMKREKLEHDSVALISLLQAFSQLGCLSLAKEVHSHLYRVNMERETPVINSLITIYAKCGMLDMARNLFEHMTYRCLTSWNSIIAAYGMHGHGIDALKLFERMKKVNVEPDEITFTSILTACSHSGMVEEGLRVYRSMTEEYSIVTREEHYNCMIDLFSRAGRLEEAYDLVKCVPSRQSASALVALLAACRVHGNMEMGEEIGRLILNLEPESPSAYALVSNLFAEGGKWDEVARIRAMVTNRGLKMTAGSDGFVLSQVSSERTNIYIIHGFFWLTDLYIVIYMDEYTMLLKMKCDNGISLNQLVHDLLSINPTRPEVFVALSVLWERKDERGALSYAKKGNLLLSMKRPEVAVIAFRGAQELRPDLRSFQGGVDPDAPEEDEENEAEDVDGDQKKIADKNSLDLL